MSIYRFCKSAFDGLKRLDQKLTEGTQTDGKTSVASESRTGRRYLLVADERRKIGRSPRPKADGLS